MLASCYAAICTDARDPGARFPHVLTDIARASRPSVPLRAPAMTGLNSHGPALTDKVLAGPLWRLVECLMCPVLELRDVWSVPRLLRMAHSLCTSIGHGSRSLFLETSLGNRKEHARPQT